MLNTPLTNPNRHSLTKNNHRTLLLFMSLILLGVASYSNKALAIPSKAEVVDHVTIHYPGNGFAASFTLPIYQVGDIRFLSAGVGIEERQATYPPFPLKLIFAQAGGAFLSGVSVTIKDVAGKEILTISKDQTSGPWLFVDLRPGTYQVTAVRENGTAVNKTVRLHEGEKKTTYLHWPA